MFSSPIRRALVTLAVFFAILFYFTKSYHYYPPTEIQVQVDKSRDTTQPISGSLTWNSGWGFNTVEKIPFEIPPASHSVRITLPQIFIQHLRVELTSNQFKVRELAYYHGSGEKFLLPQILEIGQISPQIWQAAIPAPSWERNWTLFGIQTAFAGLIGAFIWLILSNRQWTQLFGKEYIVFWGMLLFSTGIYSAWWLAYWPGGFVYDSFLTLHDASTLHFRDWHPYIYTLYTLFLRQFYDSLSTISFFQVLITAIFGSTVLFYSYRQGVNRLLIGFFFLLFCFSIPIGVSNVVIVKDVPFSIAVAILAYVVFLLRRKKEITGKPIDIPVWAWLPFFILFALACHIRHNGIVFYFATPLLLAFSLSRRSLVGIFVMILMTYGSIRWVGPRLISVQKNHSATFQQFKTTVSIMTFYNFFSETRSRDIRILEDVTQLKWNEILSLFRDGKFYTLLDKTPLPQKVYESSQGETAEYNKKFILHLIDGNLANFLGSRTYEFFHSLGIDSPVKDERNDFYENPLQLNGPGFFGPGQMTAGYPVIIPTSWPKLWRALYTVDIWSREFHGLTSRSVVIWNLLIYLVIMAGILFFESGFCAISQYVLVNIAGILPIFLAGSGESWRYYYFVYLSGIFLIPLYLATKNQKKIGNSTG